MNIKKYADKLKILMAEGLAHIIFGNYLTQALGFISSIIAVRLIDKILYANLSYADNIISYATIVSGLGMAAALVKYASNDLDAKTDNAYFKFALVLGGSIQAAITLLVCLVVSFFTVPFEYAKGFMWLLLGTSLLNYIIALNQSYNRAHLKNKFYGTIGVIQTSILILGSIIFVKWLSVNGLIFARYISLLLTTIISAKYVIPNIKKGVVDLSLKQKRLYLKTSLSLMTTNMLSWIMPLNEVFLINNIIQNETVSANFKVAGLIPSQLAILASSIAVFTFPRIVHIKEKAIIKEYVHKIGYACAGICCSVTLLGCILTPWIIRFFYGEQYIDAIQISYVLWGVRLINAAIRTVPMSMLVAVNDEGFTAKLAIISCVLQTVLDVVLLNLVGIYGMAIGTMVVYFATGFLYWRRFNFMCKSSGAINEIN